MPLKHSTETFLVILLGVVIALTGVVMGLLPPLSSSVVPWLVAFILAVAYPLVLYPLFRSRRADNPFRLLHFVPAILLLLWLVLDLASPYALFLGTLRFLYTWGWALAAVIVSFVLIALYCLDVIRQRTSRLSLLVILLVPFVAFAMTAERNYWPQRAAFALWPNLGISGDPIAAVPEDLRNLEPSDDPDEERWRAQLRRMERRNERLRNRDGEFFSEPSSIAAVSSVPLIRGSSQPSSLAKSSTTVVGMVSSARISSLTRSSSTTKSSVWSSSTVSSSSRISSSLAGVSSSSRLLSSSSSSKTVSSARSSTSSTIIAAKPPPHLSSSGPGAVGGMMLAMLAGYCGVLQKRAIKRNRRI